MGSLSFLPTVSPPSPISIPSPPNSISHPQSGQIPATVSHEIHCSTMTSGVLLWQPQKAAKPRCRIQFRRQVRTGAHHTRGEDSSAMTMDNSRQGARILVYLLLCSESRRRRRSMGRYAMGTMVVGMMRLHLLLLLDRGRGRRCRRVM